MYDTVYMSLTREEAGGMDFMGARLNSLDEVGELTFGEEKIITGRLGGLRVTINRWRIKIGNGSLCKWFLGDNIRTMERKDTQMAIERLSDSLGVPMDRAIITRLDIAKNIITRYTPKIYFKYLGELRRATRLEEPDGIYYKRSGGRLCFYDKTREMSANKEEIPELYRGKNVLRYELRYEKRVATQLHMNKITGKTLYNEDFYVKLLKTWKESYNEIQKISDLSINFEAMKTKTDLYKLSVRALADSMGGQLKLIEKVDEAKRRGDLSRKQAFDLKKAINEACQSGKEEMRANDYIKELDRKISKSIRFYR